MRECLGIGILSTNTRGNSKEDRYYLPSKPEELP